MGFFGGKKQAIGGAEEMQNWYNERYSAVAIQRNFLMFFTILILIALLVCLVIVKKLQEGKAAAPFLIEYDKNTGFMTIVESQGKREYTAQEAVKEAMLMQYIDHREAPRLSTIEDDINYVRVMTSGRIYNSYTQDAAKKLVELRNAGQISRYSVEVKNMQYMADNRVKMKITRTLEGDGVVVKSEDFDLTVTFGFSSFEMTLDDMRINPLGFQVTAYKLAPVVEKKSVIVQQTERDEEAERKKQELAEKAKSAYTEEVERLRKIEEEKRAEAEAARLAAEEANGTTQATGTAQTTTTQAIDITAGTVNKPQ